jgi:hypothetical protein
MLDFSEIFSIFSGGAGIRTLERLSALPVFKTESASPQDPTSQTTCGNSTSPLVLQLVPNSEKHPPLDPELSQVVDAWPTLPEPIRRAILSMVEAGRKGK